jgi:hypothetical protein
MIPSRVVFPLPFGPKIPYTHPGGTSKDTFLSACIFPYRFDMPFNERIVVTVLQLIRSENSEFE